MWGELGRGLDKAGSTDRAGLMAKAIPGAGKDFISQAFILRWPAWELLCPIWVSGKATLAGIERGFWLDEKQYQKRVWWFTPRGHTLEAEAGGFQVR